MAVQRQSVISSGSEDLIMSDNNAMMVQMSEKQALPPVFALGKVHRSLQNYDKDKLSALDKRLIKGFYVTHKVELENDSEREASRYA